MKPGAPRRFEAALFDMDGLLIDSERLIMRAWIDGAAATGVSLSAEAYAAVIGLADAQSDVVLKTLLGGEEVFAAVQPRAAEILANARETASFELKPGVTELLGWLDAAGVACAVASSSRAVEIEERLHRVGVLRYFGALAGGDEVQRGKPDPAVYRLAASRIGVPAVRCLAFEDSENGAQAAIAAGAKVVLVPDIKPPTAALRAQSFMVLGSLRAAMAHAPSWFGG